MGMSSQVLWQQTLEPNGRSTLEQALAVIRCTVHELPSQEWESSTGTIGGIRDSRASYLSPASPTWSSVLLHLNSLVAEPLAQELSRLSGGLGLAVLEYDQDAWGYVLFKDGSLLDQFWNIPEAVEVEPEDYRGHADVVSSAFAVPLETVRPYLRRMTDDSSTEKAFDDDKFELGNHWVRVDFMRRLRLNYPHPGQTVGGRYLRIEEKVRS